MRTRTLQNVSFHLQRNLVPRASFPLTSGRKTRALGATISGMRHRCRCAVSRITRIRLFLLFFHNGCSQSSCFPTAGQGERSSGNEIVCNVEKLSGPSDLLRSLIILPVPQPMSSMSSISHSLKKLYIGETDRRL